MCTEDVAALSTCVPTMCGDGVKAAEEECDDGNTEDNDGCSSTCSCEDDPCSYTATTNSHIGSLLLTATSGTVITLMNGTYTDQEKHMHFSIITNSK